MKYDERESQMWGRLYDDAYLESTKYFCDCVDKMECNCQEDEDKLNKKIETIKGLEMALIHANWGVESMKLVHHDLGEFIKVEFKNGCYVSYYINITGSSPQGIILDVIRFIEEKKYKV